MEPINPKYSPLLIFLFTITSLFASEFGNKIDIVKIHNKNLSVKITLKGAKIISLFNKKEGFEHIWKADKGSWNQHSPILFQL